MQLLVSTFACSQYKTFHIGSLYRILENHESTAVYILHLAEFIMYQFTHGGQRVARKLFVTSIPLVCQQTSSSPPF